MIKSIDITDNFDQYSQIGSLIENEGAVILRNLISNQDALELRNDLEICLDEDNQKYGESYVFKGMVHALMNRKQSFIDLIADQRIQDIFKVILGQGAIIHAYNSSSMPPNETNFSRSIHVDCPRIIPNYITNLGLTIALDPFTSTNGAMQIWTKSFNMQFAPSEQDFNANKIDLDNLEIGDAILFNARCWHRGGLNVTNQWRHAVTLNVCRAYMRQQFDYPELLGEEKIKLLPENVKQFIGYYVRAPYNMSEFLAPAEKRKYKPGQE